MQEKSIVLFNKAVADELTAVHQYMYFHFHCENQGYDLLANLFMRIAIEEMNHIELCAERILFLGGDVEMVASQEVQKIHDVEQMLVMARQLEIDAVSVYNQWANESSANADSASRRIFENLVDDEERHYDQFDLEMDKLKKFGDRYLALQAIEGSKGIAAGAPAE